MKKKKLLCSFDENSSCLHFHHSFKIHIYEPRKHDLLCHKSLRQISDCCGVEEGNKSRVLREKDLYGEIYKATKTKYKPMRLSFWISNLYQVFESYLFIN